MKCTAIKTLGYLLAVICCGSITANAADTPAPTPPDLTQGGKRDDNHDWLLGPTGARGWIFYRSGDLTTASRQILITAVDAGSPADGILGANDVILGVNDKPFADDARKSIGHAITAAEEKTGVLRLTRWRDGQSTNVELKLQVMGTYGDTAPYGSPKSKKIFEQGCQLIAKRGLKNVDIPIELNAMALLASGNKDYHPMLADYAKKVAASLHTGVWNWYYAYGNLFLAEYVLATGDKSIIPELKRTAMEAAKAQTMNGMWGHRPALPNGHSEGYGGMNQVGLPMTLSLALARQAGVKDPTIDKAIDRSLLLLRWYVNKGSIPYGDHQPGNSHENNGMCSSSAVLFDILGDAERTSFFSRMATAAYDERESGHCGNYWNMLWALPGASRGGPLATGAYLKEQSWYYDLARNWKGSFEYQKIEKGQENNNYTDWDLTGTYLMSFGLPLKSLYVLGKKPCAVPPWRPEEVKAVIAAGRDSSACYAPPVDGKNGYDVRNTDELLAGLSSWSPAVREHSAQALGKRDGDSVPKLLALLAGSNRSTRYGACVALGYQGTRAAVAAPQLRALLKDLDPWLQSLACGAMTHLSPEARKACVNDILALAARRNPVDPRGTVNRSVSTALFSSYPGSRTPTILENSLEGVDRRLLYPAIIAMLRNDDGEVRSSLGTYLKKMSDQDLAVMLPDILKAIEVAAPSDEMFSDDIRTAGLDILSRLHIREGMAACMTSMELRWGVHLEPRFACLVRYGVHAKALVPQLRKLRPNSPNEAKLFDKCIADIEASTDAPPLVSMKEFMAKASASKNDLINPKKDRP